MLSYSVVPQSVENFMETEIKGRSFLIFLRWRFEVIFENGVVMDKFLEKFLGEFQVLSKRHQHNVFAKFSLKVLSAKSYNNRLIRKVNLMFQKNPNKLKESVIFSYSFICFEGLRYQKMMASKVQSSHDSSSEFCTGSQVFF